MTAISEVLRFKYLVAVDKLVAEYPIQEKNRHVYERFAREASLGVVRKRVRSKGGFTDIRVNTPVLYELDNIEGPEGPEPAVRLWAPRPDGDCICTLASFDSVERAPCDAEVTESEAL